MMVLADSYLDQGEVEEACGVALRAIRIGEQLKSARCHSYVEEFRVRLSKVGDSRSGRSPKASKVLDSGTHRHVSRRTSRADWRRFA